jgi:uncharacterized membrane protein YgaE (UPF0421/DUF939 family)
MGAMTPDAAAVRRTWSSHPRLALALRAAIAAALAWFVAHLVPGPVADYPYYAPLGAVIATTSSLAGSVRESLQAVASITLGAAIAMSVAAVSPSDFAPLTVAVVVLVGVFLAGWPRLGSMGSWVATASLFVLILGRGDPVGFIGAYTGLTLVGAAVGIAVSWAWPPLPLTPAQMALDAVRRTLTRQIEDLADGVDRDQPPDPEEWAGRRRRLDPLLRRMRDSVQDATDAQMWNRRTAHYRDRIERQDRQARALERAALLVEDLSIFVSEEHHAGLEKVALGPELRPLAAEALRRLAAVCAEVRGTTEHTEDVPRATAAIAELEHAVHEAQGRGENTDTAATLVVTLRRCLQAVTDPPRRLR